MQNKQQQQIKRKKGASEGINIFISNAALLISGKFKNLKLHHLFSNKKVTCLANNLLKVDLISIVKPASLKQTSTSCKCFCKNISNIACRFNGPMLPVYAHIPLI